MSLEEAGMSVSAKLGRVRTIMYAHGVTAYLVKNTEEVLWLFNLCVDNTVTSNGDAEDGQAKPLRAAAALETEKEILFLDTACMSTELQETLIYRGIAFQPYEDAADYEAKHEEGAKLSSDPVSEVRKAIENP
jgi:hypothetical protein